MKRSGAILQVSIVVLVLVLISVGAGGLYYYTLPGAVPTANTSPGSAVVGGSGNQNTGTTKYLGYVPAGYTVAPKLAGAPNYPCPSSLNSTQCAQFQASCGNGVCDPNETCSSCPIDCGVPAGLSCDPYTGRASGVGGVCQVGIPYTNTGPNSCNPNNPNAANCNTNG